MEFGDRTVAAAIDVADKRYESGSRYYRWNEIGAAAGKILKALEAELEKPNEARNKAH
ncbi:hypothetical protein [Pseudohoeflea suaedae]|uniref:hypothetical protein n=1 Tax=Pseudohoeflea suaedae TaxID=877384 RepID=UPI001304A69A|nr:hypothetical protein [Pseudohoeflea suaedae]